MDRWGEVYSEIIGPKISTSLLITVNLYKPDNPTDIDSKENPLESMSRDTIVCM